MKTGWFMLCIVRFVCVIYYLQYVLLSDMSFILV